MRMEKFLKNLTATKFKGGVTAIAFDRYTVKYSGIKQTVFAYK